MVIECYFGAGENCPVSFTWVRKTIWIAIAMLQLRLFGRFDLRRDDGSAVSLPGRQSMAVLACLGLADDFTVARERLAELIWAGRGTEQANGSLRQELVRLRRTIGEEVLPGAGTTSQPVRLDVTDIDIDVVRFTQRCRRSGAVGRRRLHYIAVRCCRIFRCAHVIPLAIGSPCIARSCGTSQGH